MGSPASPGIPSTSSATTRAASVHVQGLPWVNGAQDDGSYVGANSSSLAQPGQTVTYTATLTNKSEDDCLVNKFVTHLPAPFQLVSSTGAPPGPGKWVSRPMVGLALGRSGVLPHFGLLALFTPAYGAPVHWTPREFGSTGPWTEVGGRALTVTEAVKGATAVALFFFVTTTAFAGSTAVATKAALSTAPEYFGVITSALEKADLNYRRETDVRVIIEKPFGTDLESARELQKTVSSAFREQQVYRIDHYLGKETVQNVMAFRFANYMFEPVWNRNYIDHIQITAAEDIGIGSRAGYYDQSGALRDLVQNHMLQLLTLVCMEPPSSFEADKVRDEKVKVLEAITPPTPEEVAKITVRAQYTAGMSGGDDAKGYLEEDDVPDDSRTETYAALRLVDDAAYCAGVWAGCARLGTVRPLLPKPLSPAAGVRARPSTPVSATFPSRA